MVNVSSVQFVMFGFVKNSVNTTCWIIWYLFAGLNLVFCLFYIIREVCFQQKYDSRKLQLESRNTNHQSLNWTLKVTLPHMLNNILATQMQGYFQSAINNRISKTLSTMKTIKLKVEFFFTFKLQESLYWTRDMPLTVGLKTINPFMTEAVII